MERAQARWSEAAKAERVSATDRKEEVVAADISEEVEADNKLGQVLDK